MIKKTIEVLGTKGDLTTFLLTLGTGLLFALIVKEPVICNDSHFYLKYSRDIDQAGLAFYSETKLPFYYWLFPTVLSSITRFNAENVIPIYIFIQCILWAGVSFFTYKIFELLTNRKTISLACGLATGLIPEALQWSAYFLSDILFIFLFSAFSFLLISIITRDNFCRKKAAILIALGILITLSRPTGFIVTALGTVVLLLHLFQKKQIKASICIILIYAISGLFIISLSPNDQSESPESRVTVSGYLLLFKELFSTGTIIHDRPQLSKAPLPEDSGSIKSTMYFTNVFLTRTVMFWSPFIKGYSLKHTLLNTVTLLPLFILAIIGIIKSIKHIHPLTLLFLVGCLIAYTCFHSLTLIDYDHRYRFPLLWILAIFAGFSFTQPLKSISKDHV